MSENNQEIIVYGTAWCGLSRRTKAFLTQHEISFRWVDIDQDTAARDYVEKLNHGFRSVPTIVFPNGDLLVEPTENELSEKLGIPNKVV